MNYVTQASYAPPGALASAKYGEAGSFAMVGAYTYNNRLQPNRMKIERTDATGCLDDPSAPGAGCILDFVYNFDADPGAGVANNGNVMGITNRRNTARSQTFTYDELNRIKTAEVPTDWGLSFGYDIWANLLSQTVTKGSAYPLSVAANDKNQIIGFCYDAAGNLVHQGACPGSSYTYDAENRLTATGGVTYTYDGDGKRVKKSNGTLYWHGAGGEVLAETDLSGVLKREYIYFNGSRVARHDAGGNWFYFADHLGSARVMTWQNGAPVEESDYYPFGGERVILDTVGAPWDNTRKFTGQERDTESGLDYFIARHYASNLGRFLQPDSFANDWYLANPQTWNRYTYARNNPLIYLDPSGAAAELVNKTPKEREAALEEVKKGLSEEAASRVYVNEVKDGDKTRYFIGIQGELAEFAELGDTAADLANIVGAQQTVELEVTDRDLPGEGKESGGAHTYAPGAIGNENVRIMFNPSQIAATDRELRTTVLGSFKFGEGRIRPMTNSVAIWHEFGHTWKMWQNIRAASGGVIPGASTLDPRTNTFQEAFKWEKRMREQLYGPSGPQNAPRFKH